MPGKRAFTPLKIRISNQESGRFLRKESLGLTGFTPLEVRRCFPTGFTLIELLVVIAIIALLLAILLPYPNKEQTLDYVINSWKDGVTEYIGYSPVSDFRRPGLKLFLADNEDGCEKCFTASH